MRWMTRWYAEKRLEAACIAADKIVSPFLHLGPPGPGWFGNIIYGPINPEGIIKEMHPFRSERDNDCCSWAACGLEAWYPGRKRSKQFY